MPMWELWASSIHRGTREASCPPLHQVIEQVDPSSGCRTGWSLWSDSSLSAEAPGKHWLGQMLTDARALCKFRFLEETFQHTVGIVIQVGHFEMGPVSFLGSCEKEQGENGAPNTCSSPVTQVDSFHVGVDYDFIRRTFGVTEGVSHAVESGPAELIGGELDKNVKAYIGHIVLLECKLYYFSYKS